jgi:hypothetical protein
LRSPGEPALNWPPPEVRDSNLVRHVYDLHAIRKHYELDQVARLARTIMQADVETYGHQFPAYRENPVLETRKAVAGLRADARFPKRYEDFLRDMVYGETLEFDEAVVTVSEIAERLDFRSLE